MLIKEKRNYVRRLNRAVNRAIDNRYSFRTAKLYKDTLRIVGFSAASFANNAYSSSQLGHICFFFDAHGKAVPISYKSYKSNRVTQSVMAGELIAFSDLFDISVAL